MNYLFTSESVSEGHPDKVADQISDAILDEFLAYDPQSKVACETLVTTGQVVLAGEVKSQAYIDLHEVARRVINRIGYTRSEYKFDGDSCGVFSAIHEQSADINRGVERADAMNQGAGDQGMMFGYACNETDNYMPLALDLSHLLLRELAVLRREKNEMPYLRPDAKSQVTVEYDEQHRPVRIHTIVISTQHDEFIAPTDNTPEAQAQADRKMLDRIADDVRRTLLPRVIAQLPERVQRLFDDRLILHVNPTGKFVIGGPHGGDPAPVSPGREDRPAGGVSGQAAGPGGQAVRQWAHRLCGPPPDPGGPPSGQCGGRVQRCGGPGQRHRRGDVLRPGRRRDAYRLCLCGGCDGGPPDRPQEGPGLGQLPGGIHGPRDAPQPLVFPHRGQPHRRRGRLRTGGGPQ